MTDGYEFSDEAYDALCRRWSTRGVRGPNDFTGALHHITPEVTRHALGLVREGLLVSLGRPARYRPEMPVVAGRPAPTTLEQWYDCAQDWASTNDRLSTDLHGECSQSHIDYLHHFFRDETSYGGWSRARTQADYGVDASAGGIVTRGVLVDLAGFHGDRIEPRAVRLPELRATLAAQGTELRPGDAVLLRFGTGSFDPDPFTGDLPGLHIECADTLLQGRPALLGGDYGTDVRPSPVPGCAVPWHLLALVYAGIRLLDGCDLEDLSGHCRRLGRYEFAVAVAPIKIPGASGSPLNAMALM